MPPAVVRAVQSARRMMPIAAVPHSELPERGELVGGRFRVGGHVGSGGAGVVFCAFDAFTRRRVALKVLRLPGDEMAGRFAREAAALRRLDHAGVARFVSSGVTDRGLPFLATDWIEGESLHARLERGPLTVREALVLGERLAAALAAVHAAAIVHRDLNPSNVMLRGGRLSEATIIDFGIARVGCESTTRPGTMLGTPAYLAPEQARGDEIIGPQADVFALGCVLYHALVGRSPFDAEHQVATLAKLLFDDTPSLREARPSAPQGLDALLARFLARDPRDRPRDGEHALLELEELEPTTSETRLRAARPVSGVTLLDGEQRLASVVVAAPVPGLGLAAALERARAAAAPLGARVEKLVDGTLVAALSGRGGARDQAELAARCALALRDAVDACSVALATGRASSGVGGLMGEVIERAVALLGDDRTRAGAGSARGEGRGVVTDAVTAGLLGPSFEIAPSRSGGLLLLGARRADGMEDPRTLLGRPTPFVGRDAELAELHAAVEACVRERTARAVVVVAPPGGGKSRLGIELLRAVRARGDVETWIARGDPMTAGSPFGMLAQVVRAAAGVTEEDALRARQAKLLDRVARHVPEPEVRHVAEFLGELAGVRFPEARSVQLRAARRSAVLMGDQMRRAWADFLAAECAAHPVALVLEDLHWGDVPTVSFVDDALRELQACPLFVLALARPEVHELFPRLWEGRASRHLVLDELPAEASARLVRAVTGDGVEPGERDRIVDRAGGNPFYLEELVRSAVEGRDEEPPPTVLAMVQARLERLPPEQRRLLRAASVFGATFWRGGVEALLGAPQGDPALDARFADLEAREVLTHRERGAFGGEYVFRHPLVREAAYAMVTEEDRAPAHRAAGAWLEQAGETDPMTLAGHYARGADSRAGAWFVRAAKQALEGDDLAAVVTRVEAGLASGATEGEDVAALRVLEAEARRWRGELVDAEACAAEAVRLAAGGSSVWFDAAAELASTASRLYHHELVEQLVDPLCDEAAEAAVASQIAACATAAVPLVVAGKVDLAARLLDRIARAGAGACAADPNVAARVSRAKATRAFFDGDLAAGLELTLRTVAAFEEAGDHRRACLQRMNAGYAQMMLGAYAPAEVTLRAALAAAQRLGIATVASMVRQNLGLVLALRGALHEARATETAAVEAALEQGDAHVAALSRAYLAQILALARNHWGAEREARAALELIEGDPAASSYALAVLAQALLATGRAREALEAASEAVATIEMLRMVAEGEALARLVYAEALWATGDVPSARLAIAAAASRLRARARRIGDAALRRSFLAGVQVHARTLALAEAWATPDAPA